MASLPPPASEDREPDLTGQQLGNFRLLRRLGRGAMAEVYLAEQASLHRLVAVKVLKSRFTEDPVAVARFQREAQAAAQLVHPNIVQIYEVGYLEGKHFIVQEYVEGENLRQWLQRHGPPDAPTTISILKQIGSALAKAAEHGVVHRDIKPENILITRAGVVKVADFGLARLVCQAERLSLTQAGLTLGTPLYMSPEQLEGNLLDSRSDLYSLGVTCYEMLSGQPPFRGDSVLSVAFQHLNKEPAPLEVLRPDLPRALCRVVHKMLAKSPQQRYGSAQELVVELERIESHLMGQPSTEVPSPPAEQPPPLAELSQRLSALMHQARHRQRAFWWAGIWALGLIGFFLGGLWAGWNAGKRPSLLQEIPPPGILIPQQESALRQWFYAAQLNTEEAWQSVIEYFPEKPYLVFRAKQQLARLYLREGRYPEAMRIFEEFILLGEPDSQMRAYGLAGQCVLYCLQGQYEEAAPLLVALWPIRHQLKDPSMQQLLRHAVEKMALQLGQSGLAEWQQWLDQKLSSQGIKLPAGTHPLP